jgi:hypothetical protein
MPSESPAGTLPSVNPVSDLETSFLQTNDGIARSENRFVSSTKNPVSKAETGLQAGPQALQLALTHFTPTSRNEAAFGSPDLFRDELDRLFSRFPGAG